MREYSADDDDFLRKVNTMEPVVIGDLLFGMGGPRGELVGVMRMPDVLLKDGGREAVAEGLRVAAARGAKVVGLGAWTAPVTAAGRTLLHGAPDGVTITTGNAYTAAVSRHNVVEAVEALDLRRQARVAVLGATGSVGVPASHLLVQEGFDVTLIGRTEGRLKVTVGDLAPVARLTTGLGHLREADVVLVLTSDKTSLVRPEHVSDGAVIIDVAQPVNIPRSSHDLFEAKGVCVVEGGLVRIPGYRSTYDLAITDPYSTFACLGETYLLSRDGAREHSVGPIEPSTSLRMERIAAWHGVRPAPLDLADRRLPRTPPEAAAAAS
ncbi:hypothetical protein [Streptomyces vastus]